jgi:DNA-binding transcriptional MerR regulator
VPHAPDRLTIGQIARLSGLTPRALRHYDRLGVLRPAEVSDANGYRLYGREQVEVARHVRILRELEVPLDEVRRILADPESEDARRASPPTPAHPRAAHRAAHHLLLPRPAGRGRGDRDVMPIRPDAIALDPQTRRKAAVDCFNHTWTLIEKPDRTARETTS